LLYSFNWEGALFLLLLRPFLGLLHYVLLIKPAENPLEKGFKHNNEFIHLSQLQFADIR